MQKTIAVINLGRLRENLRVVRSLCPASRLYAVVKADGYGHGAVEAARALEGEADGFCVAITDEGVALRAAGISGEILVFTPPMDADDIARARFYGLTVTVNSAATARLCGELNCHIKVNTGMNRYGCSIAELEDILKILPSGQVKGVYSHLYDPRSERASLGQLELFEEAEKIVKAVNPSATAHIAASGGIMRGGRFLKDAVRCGILLYGYSPDGFDKITSPVMKVYARLVQRTERVGGGAGYAPAPREYKEFSTYRLGYADGFSRTCPLGVNNLCMDAFVGDYKGDIAPVMTDASEYAAKLDTIPYEVLCSVTRRALRIYEE